MEKSTAYRTIKLSVSIIIVLTTLVLLIAVAPAFATVSPVANDSALLSGIRFAGTASDADVSYLQNSLRFLHVYLPEWYSYVSEAKPFVLSIGQTDDEGWVAANSTCCDVQGNGMMTFDDHLGFLMASNDPEDQTAEARRVAFLGVLIHEVTHLRDYRAGRMPAKMDATACIATEGAAYTKEIEFKRALVSAPFDSSKTGEDHRTAAKRQFEVEEKQFNNKFWKLYCIIAHPTMGD